MQQISIIPIKEEQKIGFSVSYKNDDGSEACAFITSLEEEEAKNLANDLIHALDEIKAKFKIYKYNKRSNRLEATEE